MFNAKSILIIINHILAKFDQDLTLEWILFSSEPAGMRGLKYSNSHHLYTNDLSKLSDIPGPRKWDRQKSDILRSEDEIKADSVANSIGQTLNKKPLKDLVDALTKELHSDIAKTRALYRWLTIQPFRTIERSTAEGDKIIAQYLLQLVEKKLTYAQLFSILCGMIGVPCVVISGFAKGSTYQVGEKLTKKHRAEWNAVLINEIWWLVDTFWGACEFVGKSRTEIKYSFDDYYFLTDPEQFIYTHFPEVLEWQLLDKPISLREFEKQACLRQRFFELDMKTLANTLCCLKTKDGDVSLVFGLNPHRSKQQTFQCYVKAFEPDKKHNTNDLMKKNDNSSSNTNNNSNAFPETNVDIKTVEENDEHYLNIKIGFHEIGEYKVEIVGKELHVKSNDNKFDWIAIFKVHVKNINRHNFLLDDQIKPIASEAHEQEKQQQSNIVVINIETDSAEKAKIEEEMKKAEQKANEINNLRQEASVGDVIEKGYMAELGVEIAEAKESIDRLKRLQKLMQGVHKVMKATLLLLGNYEEETKDWKNVQTLIGKTGKMSLKKRVTELDIESLQLDIALGSKQILEGTKFETIFVTSAGAAAFFNWTTGIISEMEQKYANNIAQLSQN
ncbi:hypothetical protein ACJMK2_008509 [Sinanodonta woodiana]|uniref:KY-like immunoglobulin-like domain-containing protein n=1 Tax=Sinanodonta woodiana TaxID=1069815 RepID=A0ABD3VLT9_SINWO